MLDVGIWQAGDGARYMVNSLLMFQTCAACAAMDAKNKFSQIAITGTVSNGPFKQQFQHVGFNRAAADTYRSTAAARYYNELWQTFQAPSSDRGEAVVAQLCHLRRMTLLNRDKIEAKFGAVSDRNKDSLTSLDRELTGVQLVRDVGFASVIFLSSGGVGAVGNLSLAARSLIASAAIVSKAGTKVYDINATVTDKAEKASKYTSVAFGTAMDVLFSGVSLGKASTSLGETFIIAVVIKAPAEGIKTALDGGSGAQIALATGFEAFAPFTEGLGEAIAGKLLPQFTKAGTETIKQLGQHSAGQIVGSAKDAWAMPALAQSSGGGGTGRLWDLFSLLFTRQMSPEAYFRNFVIKRV